MPMRLRTKTTRPADGPGSRSAACAAGLLLAGVARSFEEPGAASRRPPRRPHPVARRGPAAGPTCPTSPTTSARGAGPGTGGIDAAADYIAGVFKSAGLKPAAGRRRLFPAVHDRRPAEPRQAPRSSRSTGPTDKAIDGQPKTDFTPLAIGIGGRSRASPSSSPATGSPPRTTTHKLDYDDYAGHRRQGQGRPDPPPRAAGTSDDKSPFDGQRTNRLRDLPPQGDQRLPARRGRGPARQRPARRQGEEGRPAQLRLRRRRARYSTIPFVMVTREFADKVLAAAGQPDAGEDREGRSTPT